jgi:NAD(P)-dependent dehydrogenase (short-subunit alcohol dehydrogenase family)
MNKRIIVISANSDIGYNICKDLRKDGWEVYGTYRKEINLSSLKKLGVKMYKLDMSQSEAVKMVSTKLRDEIGSWNVLINATGMQSPIGKFEKVDINAWVESVHVNFIEQVRVVHYLLPVASKNSSVIFFAGGGTNNAVKNYSAYTISKVALIKTCEILDFENEDVSFSIIGPGWVKTRIHDETLGAGEQLAEENYQTTLQHFDSGEFTPIEDVQSSIRWVMSQPKSVVGGRNFSTVYDAWGVKELEEMLANDFDMYKLRRNGNDRFINSKNKN